jgi:hypothetical protein
VEVCPTDVVSLLTTPVEEEAELVGAAVGLTINGK